jgi:hypothetical protein
MGGRGSTRWRGHVRRARVSESLEVAANVFAGAAGSLLVSPRASVTVTLRYHGGLVLRAELSPHAAHPAAVLVTLTSNHPPGGDARMTLLAHRQPQGGTAWRWDCPCCGRGARAVYRLPQRGAWSCRRCAGLAYTTQQLGLTDRLAYGMQGLILRAGGDASHVLSDFPALRKPKGMHAKTFARLYREWDARRERREALFNARFARFLRACARYNT